jgi:hypothetical protein
MIDSAIRVAMTIITMAVRSPNGHILWRPLRTFSVVHPTRSVHRPTCHKPKVPLGRRHDRARSISPEVLEPVRRQRRVDGSAGDGPMGEADGTTVPSSVRFDPAVARTHSRLETEVNSGSRNVAGEGDV